MIQPQQVILAGGNGYIGGATAYALQEAGFNPIILDNFSTSQKGVLKAFRVFEVNLTDWESVHKIMNSLGPITAIFHFAAKALVPESFRIPEQYFQNNLGTSKVVAELAKTYHIPFVIHSSSCAVYGSPRHTPITEQSELKASSPYGETKIQSESILNSFHQEGHFKALNLRYFNPAGSYLKYSWGENHEPETHLIPNVVKAALRNQPVNLYGDAYPTPDGSCIRDFIHIVDLAAAHVLSLQALLAKKDLPQAVNIGRGQGNSVLEVIQTAEKVIGKKIIVSVQANRPGDPAELVADNRSMLKILNWRPKRTLEEMIKDDWTWRSSLVK